MEILKNAIAWVEIPVSDFDRAKRFYSSIYDYEMPEMMMRENRMGFLLYDQTNGGVGAAIVQGPDYYVTDKGVKVYLNGGLDLNTVLNRVEKAAGKIILEKAAITSEFGYFAVFEDSEGNHIALHAME